LEGFRKVRVSPDSDEELLIADLALEARNKMLLATFLSSDAEDLWKVRSPDTRTVTGVEIKQNFLTKLTKDRQLFRGECFRVLRSNGQLHSRAFDVLLSMKDTYVKPLSVEFLESIVYDSFPLTFLEKDGFFSPQDMVEQSTQPEINNDFGTKVLLPTTCSISQEQWDAVYESLQQSFTDDDEDLIKDTPMSGVPLTDVFMQQSYPVSKIVH